MNDASNKPNQTRRNILAGFTAATAAALLPLGAQSNSSAELKTLIANQAKIMAKDVGTDKLTILIPNGCIDNLRPVITAFKAATQIDINFIETPVDDINTQLILDIISGDGLYDLALPATFGIPDLVSANAITPLSSYAEKYEPMGFRDGILYGIGDSFDDDTYGFQADGDTYVMFYNKDFLENTDEQQRYEETHGRPLEIPLTWQELDQQMAFFNRKEDGMFGGLLFRTPGYLAWEWWVRFHAKGYWPMSESLEPQINSDAGIQALEEMIKATEHLAPDTNHLGLFENWERYSQGDIYCNIGWGGTQKYLNSTHSPMRNRMRYGPTPGGMIDGELLLTPYFNWGWNYVVTTGSEQPELAYLFALFASTPEMSLASVQQQGGFFDPIRTEHYKDAQIQMIYSEEFLAVHEASLKSSIPDLYIANQSEYFNELNHELDQAINNKIKPKIALDRVAQKWDLISNSSNRTLQSQRWRNLRAKYPAHIKSRLQDI